MLLTSVRPRAGWRTLNHRHSRAAALILNRCLPQTRPNVNVPKTMAPNDRVRVPGTDVYVTQKAGHGGKGKHGQQQAAGSWECQAPPAGDGMVWAVVGVPVSTELVSTQS